MKVILHLGLDVHNESGPVLVETGTDRETQGEPILIGDDCFIGCGAVILHGVKLGKNCIVGANSVVTKSFEDYSVIAGSPAKLLRTMASEKL